MDDIDQRILLGFESDIEGADLTITVQGFKDPMLALAALRKAGSDDYITKLIEQMQAQIQEGDNYGF